MKKARSTWVLAVPLILLWVPTIASAKAPTVKITVSGGKAYEADRVHGSAASWPEQRVVERFSRPFPEST